MHAHVMHPPGLMEWGETHARTCYAPSWAHACDMHSPGLKHVIKPMFPCMTLLH
jgi:hypothetical protein